MTATKMGMKRERPSRSVLKQVSADHVRELQEYNWLRALSLTKAELHIWRPSDRDEVERLLF